MLISTVCKSAVAVFQWRLTVGLLIIKDVTYLLRCVDYVRLYLDLESPAVNERVEWNYELCDSDLTSGGVDKYYSSTPWLLMALHTDKLASNRTGFRAFYRFLDKSSSTARCA